MYLGIVIECSYYLFFKKSILHLWKIRILIKATLLSLAHLNPVFTVSMLIFIDIALVVLEFVTVKSKPKLSYIYQYPKLWMIDNILCDVALGILILLPIILLSLVIISIIVVYVICS